MTARFRNLLRRLLRCSNFETHALSFFSSNRKRFFKKRVLCGSFSLFRLAMPRLSQRARPVYAFAKS